jgi:hypothetical protein
MALDARLVGRLEMEEMLVFGTVCSMAAQALQCDVLVPRIYDLFTDWMRRMRLPFMARFAELERRRFIQEQEIVRTMRRVAFSALALRNRRMLRL